MQLLRPHPKPSESEPLQAGPGHLYFTRLSGDSEAHSSLRTTAPSIESQMSVYIYDYKLSAYLKSRSWPLIHRDLVVPQWGCRNLIFLTNIPCNSSVNDPQTTIWGNSALGREGLSLLAQFGLLSWTGAEDCSHVSPARKEISINITVLQDFERGHIVSLAN